MIKDKKLPDIEDELLLRYYIMFEYGNGLINNKFDKVYFIIDYD
jgi:hypothetical protein